MTLSKIKLKNEDDCCFNREKPWDQRSNKGCPVHEAIFLNLATERSCKCNPKKVSKEPYYSNNFLQLIDSFSIITEGSKESLEDRKGKFIHYNN